MELTYSIGRPALFPQIESWGLTLDMAVNRVEITEQLQDGLGYKLLIVIEKRQVGFFMSNQWRTVMETHYPTIPVLELILVHQLSQIIFLPVLWVAFWTRLLPEAISTTFVHIGPCREFMREIRMQNPYIPNVYLVDQQGRAVWVSSSAPTEEDLAQLESIIHRRKRPFGERVDPRRQSHTKE